MAAPSSPSLPSSFDPAIHLCEANGAVPFSDSHSSELEAFNLQQLETIREKTKKGIVIQHRAWNLSEIFRSDEDIQPETPTKHRKLIAATNTAVEPSSDTVVPSSPPVSKMPLLSSPVLYPPSSPALKTGEHKRKSEGPSSVIEPKRPRMIGGFVDEDDDDDDDDIQTMQDAQLPHLTLLENSPGHSQILDETTLGLGLANDRSSLGNDNGLDTSAQPSIRSATPTSVVGGQASQRNRTIPIKSCSGKVFNVQKREIAPPVSYERLIAERSTTAPGKATRSYYGVNIHQLMDQASKETEEDKVRRANQTVPEPIVHSREVKKKVNPMWADKYRARKFTDLLGDDRTHRSALRWLKGWDPIVFPGLARARRKTLDDDSEERTHRKILLLTGAPGLGKTTLAHVCARQAGYETLEINASDDRSRDVVKGRIKDALATENVRGVNVGTGDKVVRKAGKPVCVVVDEVDGVTTGSGAGGEGGFMKALVDLVQLDQQNSSKPSDPFARSGRKSQKREKFRMLRPLILICNDLYHPSIRPLRTSSLAEIIQVRQPPIEKVIQRIKGVFEKEGIPCDLDGARRLCEASWGMGGARDNRNRAAGEGDIRGALVAGEWIAHKFRSACLSSNNARLTKRWIDQNILNDTIQGSSSSHGLGRGGTRAIIDRVFQDGAGLPNTLNSANPLQTPGFGQSTMGVAEHRKSKAINWLREMVDTSGEYDRCITDCFARYPTITFQDDTALSKPNAAYEWLHFHDKISSKVFSNQEWELNPYLSQSVLAFHHLFSTASNYGWGADHSKVKNGEDEEEEHPFSGPRADFAAFEAGRQNRAMLVGFQACFSAHVTRSFNSMETVVTDLIPNLIRILSPNVKPVMVGGSEQKGIVSVRKENERKLVMSAVNVMCGMGVKFEQLRVEMEDKSHGGWVYRMEPPLDTLTSFSKIKGTTLASSGSSIPVRYAVRQVLDHEYRKDVMRRQSESQRARNPGAELVDGPMSIGRYEKAKAVKASRPERDFFGRILPKGSIKKTKSLKSVNKVWVTYKDGYSKAVRKPISMVKLMEGF